MQKYLLPYFAILMIVLLTASCADKEPKSNTKVSFIKKDIVHLEDGSEIKLGDSLLKVFYLIRHAEKDTQKTDPILSEAGIKRAERLTEIMRQSWLDAVYTTLTSRTMLTVDSITQYKGLSNNIYTNDNMKETFTEVMNSPSVNRILIVGHSNTIPPLANFLYGKTHFNKTIDDKTYDNFIIVVQQRDSTKKVYELKY
ncbi:MAG TPA: histidine phosphatase family protein [Saprospiraceae bacterium]|nr:histidine phosphatase family protein [Saprospiraceae bacterium]